MGRDSFLSWHMRRFNPRSFVPTQRLSNRSSSSLSAPKPLALVAAAGLHASPQRPTPELRSPPPDERCPPPLDRCRHANPLSLRRHQLRAAVDLVQMGDWAGLLPPHKNARRPKATVTSAAAPPSLWSGNPLLSPVAVVVPCHRSEAPGRPRRGGGGRRGRRIVRGGRKRAAAPPLLFVVTSCWRPWS